MSGRFDVRVTDTAYRDLLAAALYMRDRLVSPVASDGFLDEFELRVKSLETFPEARPPVADYELARLGYRWIPVGNFMLFYRVDLEHAEVTVDRLLYGSSDWRSLVGGE